MSLISLRQLTVRYGTGRHALTAVDHVNLDIDQGAVVGLVGESGSGKSTLARAVVGLVPVRSGQILLDGTDIAHARYRQRRAAARVQLVFQNPYTALDPRMTVGESIGEALTARSRMGRGDRARETARLLDLVGLEKRMISVLPRELSGGQRQRVALVRALAAKPQVLMADEITSALDVSVQGAILNLIRDIHDRLGLSMLFISHNLAAVNYVSDVVAVMYLGQIVELAPTEQLLRQPQHPYTRTLINAIPRLVASPSGPDAPTETATALPSEPSDPRRPPTGCRFHTRCPFGPLAFPDRVICRTVDPQTDANTRLHSAACHFVGESSVDISTVGNSSLGSSSVADSGTPELEVADRPSVPAPYPPVR